MMFYLDRKYVRLDNRTSKHVSWLETTIALVYLVGHRKRGDFYKQI